MANVVIDMQSGTVLEKATSPTSSTEPRGQATSNPTFSGVVRDATPLDTQAHSGAHLSDDERLRLAKIKRDRRNGWMASFDDYDFLLSLVERLNR
jgi:hypothetical protein